MQVTILGCGGAGGVPTLSRGWGHCDPAHPRNRRRRPSILVTPGAGQGGGGAASPDPILVDTAPDLREQLLEAGVTRLSAVLYTHAHADHVHGIDDLREINRVMGCPIDVYSDAETLEILERRFPYALAPQPADTDYIFKPLLISRRIAGALDVAGVRIRAFEQDHGVMTTLGFRFGDGFAYSTDVVALDDAAFATLAGVHTWVVGCMGWSDLPTHAHVDKVLGWAARVQPRRLVLTHLGPGMDYETLRRRLPEDAEPAHDGMVLEVPD
ncbi:MBL fold metallo-hydrolase [Roseospira visakhapatnamensis]|uniref:Phosphoribosyl 1,2-cyclic phosphate phosphodiesterase n=1 Tax=Roseospira visakhapatnamensis TaxID=390880 RepID=A0A7W6WBD7_9PROT|nr:MBL fold metallo-hydrolase [Roseospira visakhapatnamensis]MBB4267437.1 phosphoribosyl 1,2-cyclic phosphate phosphodiesterase [Roseospira visakhapatnamensis]